ncbi:MAG: hypothetical protein JWL86_690 [Rhizobium sp.]|nr:hypothetical protein [Rhizobium sp.]
MMAAGFLTFPVLAALSVVLLMFHVLLQSSLAVKETGKEWNAGPRDSEPNSLGVMAGRAQRASGNFRETYPGFVVLVLALAVGGDTSGIGLAGTLVWFAARIIYIPLYLGGVPYIRSYVWLVAAGGLAMMFLAVLYSAYST